jgi:serine/threonine protein kinase
LQLHTSQTISGGQLLYLVSGELDLSPAHVEVHRGFGAKAVFRKNTNASLPEGLTMDSTTGIISGVPRLDLATSEVEYYQVDVVVEAQAEKEPHTVFENSMTQAAKFRLTLSPPILETGQSGFTATVGSWYEGPIPSVTGGRKPLVFSYANVSTADLPNGLEINRNTGQITGTPTTPSAGEVTMAVIVTDANAATKHLQTIGLTVNPSITVTWTNAPPTTVVGESYPLNFDFGLNETRLTELVYRSNAGSVLPPGLKLDCGGNIYGTATTPGKYVIDLTATDSEGSQASVTLNGGPVEITVAECTDNFTCTGHGWCEVGDDSNTTYALYDGNFTCSCAIGWTGDDCKSCAIHWTGTECDACQDGWSGDDCNLAASHAPFMSDTTVGGLAAGVMGTIMLMVGIAFVGRWHWKARTVKKRIAKLEALAFADIELIDTASLDGVLFEAIKLQCFSLVQPLLIRGANASKRDTEMQLPITRLLAQVPGDRSNVTALNAASATSPNAEQQAADDRTDAVCFLLSAHFEFDLTLGLAMVQENFFEIADVDKDGTLSFDECKYRGMPKEVFNTIDADGDGIIDVHEFQAWITKIEREKTSHPLIRMAVGRIAASNWRASDGTKDTVAHRLLIACRERSLNENQTVELLEIALKSDPTILTVNNSKHQTPTELAITCEGKLQIQTRFTVVLFNRYQIVRPQHPLYKSPTAEVHECIDLAKMGAATNSDVSNKRFVVKLMSDPDLWMRELKTRDVLSADGADAAGSYVGAISAAIISSPFASDDIQCGAAGQAASQYATSASTQVRPIITFKPSFVEKTRRDEARNLMSEYPYAIQMPLADRNLNEIIASERLAEEPLDVIRQSSRKVLNLIQDLHSSGVIHGDVKPKNIVRVDRTLMLIDLDMAITVGSSDPPAHADPKKFSGSTAYAAPELHQWMARHISIQGLDPTYTGDGSSPTDNLVTLEQIDLWSFAVTLYEMATGSPLFQNSYDRATPATLDKLKNWNGLEPEHSHQIESLHGAANSAPLRDVLAWAFAADAASRPQSIAALVKHAFFDPRGGAMREDFVVEQIKELLLAPPTNGEERLDVNVMVSYSWADTNFVLSRLTMELAPRVRELWLDRLGGAQGMGEFAKASMQRGVQNADVIIAVVSPTYMASKNCGFEMEVAHAMGKPIIPIVLNVPFNEWPPQRIGDSRMVDQFATETGDVKIFVDLTDPASFFHKFKKELLPRLSGGPGGFLSTNVGDLNEIIPPLPAVDVVEAGMKAALASDSQAAIDVEGYGAPQNRSRPKEEKQVPESQAAAVNGTGSQPTSMPAYSAATQARPKKGNNKVAPAPHSAIILPPPPAPGQSLPSPNDKIRGQCGRCGQPVYSTERRDKDETTGIYYHVSCPTTTVASSAVQSIQIQKLNTL